MQRVPKLQRAATDFSEEGFEHPTARISKCKNENSESQKKGMESTDLDPSVDLEADDGRPGYQQRAPGPSSDLLGRESQSRAGRILAVLRAHKTPLYFTGAWIVVCVAFALVGLYAWKPMYWQGLSRESFFFCRFFWSVSLCTCSHANSHPSPILCRMVFTLCRDNFR